MCGLIMVPRMLSCVEDVETAGFSTLIARCDVTLFPVLRLK